MKYWSLTSRDDDDDDEIHEDDILEEIPIGEGDQVPEDEDDEVSFTGYFINYVVIIIKMRVYFLIIYPAFFFRGLIM